MRAGIQATTAPVVGYCDVDLSAGTDALWDLYAEIRGGGDIVIASRGLAASVLEVRQPWYREQAGRAWETFKSFKQWLAEQEADDARGPEQQGRPGRFPTFREWLATRDGK